MSQLTNSLTIIEPSAATDLNRAIARISIGKSRELVGSQDFKQAAIVMGKQLTAEVSEHLRALNAVWTKDLPASVLDYLDELGNAILS